VFLHGGLRQDSSSSPESTLPGTPIRLPARTVPARAHSTARVTRRLRRLGRQQLQREQLLSGPGAHRNAIGDRVTDQVIHRTGLGAGGQEMQQQLAQQTRDQGVYQIGEV
jgi:hypothetical protein